MTASNERGARVRFPPPLVFLGCTLVALLAQHYVIPLSAPNGRPFTTVGGIVLILLGAASVASARLLFVRTAQSPTPWSPTPALIARGSYRYTRNPMYVGLTALLIGVGIAIDVLWISLFAFVALTVIHFIAVVKEEAYLAAKFGDQYAAYKARVRRYL